VLATPPRTRLKAQNLLLLCGVLLFAEDSLLFELGQLFERSGGISGPPLYAGPVPFSRTDIIEIKYMKSHARIMMQMTPNIDADAARDQPRWTFLTNHFHVLACLDRDPELRIRDIADLVGITERATVQILNQLEASGYLTKARVGRRNHYTVHGELPLRHPLDNERPVGELLRVIEPETSS
jgi:CRP-like cAMP-binding protein